MSTRPVTTGRRAVLVAATALGLATMLAAGFSVESTLQAVNRPALSSPADASSGSPASGAGKSTRNNIAPPAAATVSVHVANHDSDD